MSKRGSQTIGLSAQVLHSPSGDDMSPLYKALYICQICEILWNIGSVFLLHSVPTIPCIQTIATFHGPHTFDSMLPDVTAAPDGRH